MSSSSNPIVAALRREILLTGTQCNSKGENLLPGSLSFLADHLPDAAFPLKAVHEFLSTETENLAATYGFISGLVSSFCQPNAVLCWIGQEPAIFPNALQVFGLKPEHILFIQVAGEKELHWAVEEALKCKSLGAVVATVPALDFTRSRRWQLLTEKNRVPAFVVNTCRYKPLTNACVSRWQIRSAPSYSPQGLPGVGHTAWDIDLLKIRNGRPGQWRMCWQQNSFMQSNDVSLEKLSHTAFAQTG